jgi:PilZ domain-containing protein
LSSSPASLSSSDDFEIGSRLLSKRVTPYSGRECCLAIETQTAGAETLSLMLPKGLGFGLRGRLSAELKKYENRRAPRRGSNDNAWIRPEDSFGLQPCQVVDISRTGVRLRVANFHKVPGKFILMFSKNGKGCLARVKWQRGTQVGAELLSSANSGDTASNDHAAGPSKRGEGKLAQGA